LGVGHLNDPVEMIAGHERIEVDITELCDAKAIKSGWNALERNSDLANESLLRLV
jgi:hypothetical protein